MVRVRGTRHQEAAMSESGVPIACTLHPNEMGGRLEEWHRLFAAHLGGIQRPAPTRLRLILAADAGVDRVRDLAAREMACCAFMAFTVTLAGGRLLLDAEVPAEAAPTLDGLAGIAERAARTPAR
jgi:uncharacterized protein YbjT (DUF2867 family)